MKTPIQKAYEQGYRACAKSAGREDLIARINSASFAMDERCRLAFLQVSDTVAVVQALGTCRTMLESEKAFEHRMHALYGNEHQMSADAHDKHCETVSSINRMIKAIDELIRLHV